MKIKYVLSFGILLALTSNISANQMHNPDFVAISAKYAKLKAKQRTITTEVRETEQSIDSLLENEPGSCDLNIGNVIVDDIGNTPDDVVIIIEGDILQSNNCR